MSHASLQIIINADYALNGATPEALRSVVERAVAGAIGSGLLTRDSNVEAYRHSVEVNLTHVRPSNS